MNEKFIKALKDKELFSIIDGKLKWNGHQFTKISGWPKGLDTENFFINEIDDDCIYGEAGGDWQDITCFELVFKDGKLAIVPFLEAPSKQSKGEKTKIGKEIIASLESLNESKDTDVKELKKSFDEFNKKFFDGKLPEVAIKITDKDTDHSKGVAGSFNFNPKVHTSGEKNKDFKLTDLRRKLNKDELEDDAYNYIVNNAYIEMPKDIVKRGKYYYASVLIHEMVHEFIELLSNSHETDPHGSDFKRKVDEINKKSHNEYRVAYEEVPQILNSKDRLDKRPDGDEE